MHKTVAWNTQLEQDQVEQEGCNRLAQEEEATQQAQHKNEAGEQHREVKKNMSKFGSFDPLHAVNESIAPRLAQYALSKIGNWEYIKLDYFVMRGCREVFVDMNKSISHDTLAFTQIEDTITIHPLAALRPSRHIRNNKDLSWVEMLQAKNVMLHFIAKSRAWPATHTEAFAVYYVNLELHPRKSVPFGEQALMLYQARVRQEWFDAFKQEEGFNIALIQDNLLHSIVEEINSRIIFGRFDQVICPCCLLLLTLH